MDPSDHDRKDPHNGTPGDDRHTHSNGVLGEEVGWLRSVMQYSSEIIMVVDLDGTLRYASPAFRRVLGHDPDEAIGTKMIDYVHPEDLPRVLEETEKALVNGKPATSRAEYRFRHKDGSWRWVESLGTYLLDDPAVRGVVVSVREITERKEAEEKIRFQAQLLGAVGEAVVAIDVDGRVVYWNRAAERMYGWSAEEIMGCHLRKTVVLEDHRGRAEEIMAAVRAGSTWSGEFVLRRRDGSTFLAEAVNTPVLGEDGGLRSVIRVLRDVAESKETEEGLKKSEAKFFSVLESITDGFFILDREWRFAYVNPQAALMLNRDREDLVGEKLREDETFYPEYRRAIREDRTVQFEGFYPRFRRWYGIRACPSETGLSVYVQDVTERKEAERRLSEAEERYRTLVEQVPAIAYVRHHEISSLGGVTYVSPQVEAVLGYTQQEYASDSQFWRTILHPDDRERVVAEDERAAETGEPFELEYRLIAKDAGTVWIRESGTLVRREDDGTQLWHGIMFDISETKRVEGELREAEARYRILVERVSPTIYIERPREGETAAYDTTYISPRVEEVLGYPPQMFVEDPGYWNSLIHPEDLEAVQREDARTDETGEPFSIEYRVRAADGRTVWIRDEATAVRNEAGEVSYWLGVRTDITERKEAEERYRTLVERMPAVTYIEEVGDSHRTLYVSPQVEGMLGYPQEEWLGGIHHWARCLHPEDRERVLAEDARSNSTGEPFKTEYRMLNRERNRLGSRRGGPGGETGGTRPSLAGGDHGHNRAQGPGVAAGASGPARLPDRSSQPPSL